MKKISKPILWLTLLGVFIAGGLLVCPAPAAHAAGNPDLLDQLDDLETGIQNAAGNTEQILGLIRSTITRFPGDALFIAAFAAFLVPDMAADIAKTAAGIVPKMATEIAFAVTYAVPGAAESIKEVCSGIAPEQSPDIFIAVEVAAEKRKHAVIEHETAQKMAQKAAEEAEIFIQDISAPPPATNYGR